MLASYKQATLALGSRMIDKSRKFVEFEVREKRRAGPAIFFYLLGKFM